LSELPFVDRYSVEVAASPEYLWDALVGAIGGRSLGPAGPALARILGCEDGESKGPRPLSGGSTLPGFHVVEADEPNRLILEGRHRYSRYHLTMSISASNRGGASLCAETRAAFPGTIGWLYRKAVIGSGGHGLLVRQFLAGIKSSAEKKASSGLFT
jgi:hypothetical protein